MILRDRAQGLVEYGLIIALVALLAIAGLIVFGPAMKSLLSKLGGSVQSRSLSGNFGPLKAMPCEVTGKGVVCGCEASATSPSAAASGPPRPAD